MAISVLEVIYACGVWGGNTGRWSMPPSSVFWTLGSLQPTRAGEFTPWKLANAPDQGFSSPPELINVHWHTTSLCTIKYVGKQTAANSKYIYIYAYSLKELDFLGTRSILAFTNLAVIP